MSIQKEPPHAVMHVDDIQDFEGRNCNDLVCVGDLLVAVDDVWVQSADIDALDAAIWGPLDSIVKLSFASGQDSNYCINVKRHIPINTWNEAIRWYEPKPEFKDTDFLAENKIVMVIFQCCLISPLVLTNGLCYNAHPCALQRASTVHAVMLTSVTQ